MWEIIKGNAFQVSSLCDNNETLIKCIWAPARAVLLSRSSIQPALFPRPPPPHFSPRGLITGFAMLKLFSSQSKQTHLREASNSICALRGSLGSPINRAIPLYETKRYVRTFGLFRCEREIERPRSAFCAEKCGCFSFFLIVPRHRQSWMDRWR